MDFTLLPPRDQIVRIMERIYGSGMTTTSGGNLSIREDDGTVWITPGGVDKGGLGSNDIVRVDPSGEAHGNHRPSIELPFHQSVYRRRPDVRAVVHAHPPALVAFSIVRTLPDTSLLPSARLVCGNTGLAPYALPGSRELGEVIADVLESGVDTAVLENHGVVVVGEDLHQAYRRFETFETLARLEIRARRIGTPVSLTEDQMALFREKARLRIPEDHRGPRDTAEREARIAMTKLIHRAYDHRLFTSTQGTFSTRLEEDRFLITPYGVDRKYLEPEDLVVIDEGRKEPGSRPSRSVFLHREIYNRRPSVASVIIAHPPHIMAFAVVRTPFDSRTIPESYVMLRDIPVYPFGTNIENPETIAEGISDQSPLALVENDSLLVTGDSLLGTFDRLEVAEFSARSILDSQGLGPIVPINEDEAAALREAFGLP